MPSAVFWTMQNRGRASAAKRLRWDRLLLCIPWLLVFAVHSHLGFAQEIRFTDDGKQIKAFSGNRPILVYHKALNRPPKEINPVYARSGYIHPLYSPSGKIVTDDFSDDHAHQHGLFYAFVKVQVDGQTLDFWNQHRKLANVEFVESELRPKAPNPFRTHQRHYRLKDQRTIFDEWWSVQVSADKNCFLIDLDVAIKNATEKPIRIEKNHYGSFGIRGSGSWRKPDLSGFEFLTSAGKHRKDGNLQPARWVAMSGKVDGQVCGLAVIGHPENDRFPQPARLHPTMPYFSFAPMAIGPFDLPPGKPYRSRFRIVTFDGRPNPNLLNELAEFASESPRP